MRYRVTITDKETNETDSIEYVWVDSKLISIVIDEDNIKNTAKYLYNDFDEPIGMLLTDEDGNNTGDGSLC